jgi:uncharacterized repeat protein (TIGR01451 family)
MKEARMISPFRPGLLARLLPRLNRFLRGPGLLAAPLLTAMTTALLFLLVAAPSARAACVTGACVTAGPRLASVSTTQGALLNPVLGGLLGTSVNLNVADWNTLATGDVNALAFLNALQVQTGVSSPTQALNANVTVAQVAAALQAAAGAQANTSLSNTLSTVASQVAGAGGTVRVGDLLKVGVDAGGLATSTLNSLDVLTGTAQLYNQKNVLTTPTPIGVSGGVLGMLGVINNAQVYVQAVEPPVMICGATGTTFHSSAVRLKLKLDLVTLSPATTLLTALPGVSTATIAISQLDIYVEVARAEGILGVVDAVTKAVTVQAAPGIADVYIGSMADNVFFNRSRILNAATDLTYGKIGTLALNSLRVDIEVKSSTRGQAPFTSTLNFTGPYPQTKTISTSSVFTTNLANSLINNLSLRTTPSLGLLDAAVLPVLKTVVTGALSPVLAPVLSGVVDPLLQTLGVGLGQAVITVTGLCSACDDFKLTKAVDKADAVPGSTITYTITYQNSGTTILTGLKVLDATPGFTVYAEADCGTLGSGLTGCTVLTKPAVGAAGPLEWRFAGALQPGATGTVTFKALVQ